jgi:hypothetical protein
MAAYNRVGDLEIGQDLDFQQKEWTVQRIGWVVMALIAIATLLGLLGGPGPLSDITVGSNEDMLSLELNRFGHLQEPTTLRIRLNGDATASNPVRVWLDLSYLHDVQVEHVMPEPESVEAAEDRLVYSFQMTEPGQPATITFQVRPERPGALNGQVGIEGGASHDFSQFIYP